MSSDNQSKSVPQNLDSSFVNLWALLRKLSKDGFVGRVHVELTDYSADVFVTGSGTPLVREIDRAAGTDVLEEAALHRVVLRTRESPGSITVFEGVAETVPARGSTMTDQANSSASTPADPPLETSAAQRPVPPAVPVKSMAAPPPPAHPKVEDKTASEWGEVVSLSGELIKSVERALTESGADFDLVFDRTRLELADDYTFLDPMQKRFAYANGTVTMLDEMNPSMYIAGLSEVLRRTIDKLAAGDRARRVRERVALEFALLARKRPEALKRTGFYDRLEKIAGTKVI